MVILDISKPDCCYNCPCYCGMDGYSYCAAREYDVSDGDTIPEWCPMKTLEQESVLDKTESEESE